MNSQRKDNNRSREAFYNESREHAYNRQKDLHKEIEIDVPELVENDETPVDSQYEERDSIFEKKEHLNVSAKIIQDYQMGHLSQPLIKSMSNSKLQRGNQPLSRTTNSIQGIRNAERKVEDLYKWQERINKKHEMQREFQEQIKDSMYDYKIYTNELSNQIMEAKRPHEKVENLLLARGKAKEMRLKSLEKKLYGGTKVPSITERARKIQHDQNVYTRLYDLDKSRREQSREALSRHQSQIMDLRTQRSKSETKVKHFHAALQSPPRKNLRNIDFFFSPVQTINSNPQRQQQFSRESYISPRAAVTSPTNNFVSPIYRNYSEAAENKNTSVQYSMDKSREESSPGLQNTLVNPRKPVDNSKVMPISIYRRLTPWNKMSSEPQNQQQQQQSQGQIVKNQSENQIPYSMRSKVENPNNSNVEQEPMQRQQFSPEMSQTERAPVLPNMLYFKNHDRPQSLTPQTHLKEAPHVQRERHEKPITSNNHRDIDIKSMEVFWEQILQDDIENRGRKHNNSNRFEDHEYNEGYKTSQYKLDFGERSKLWMDKKNKKIENQRKHKQQQELKNCTFKPHLYSQEKSNKNQQQQMYNNFLHRMEQQANTVHVPLDSMNSPAKILQKYGFSPMQTMGDLDWIGISSDNSPKNGRYVEDNDLQKKLYNYILDAKR